MAEYVDIDYPFTAYTDRGQTIETSIRKIMQTNPFLDIPIADVVERKHGKWINPRPDSEMCSACGVRFSISSLFSVGGNEEPNFCPNCGADMRIDNAED